MSSPKPKENDEKEDSNELQWAALAMQELIVSPVSGSLLKICSQLSQHNLHLRRLSFPVEHYMEGFMRSYLRLPGTHLLGRVTVVNAAILVLQCARFDGDQIELLELRVNKCTKNDERIQPFKWSLLPSTFIPNQSLMTIEPESNYQMETESHNEVESSINIQQLEERAMEIRKRLSEPCSSEMAIQLREELFKTLQNVPYTPEGIIYDLDREYSNSESGSITDSSNEIEHNVESDMDPITVNKMMEEQGNLARCETKIINLCHQKGGETITMAHVMENKPSSRVSQYFMASLALASEKKVQLQSTGKQGEAITMDELDIKLKRET